MTPNARRQQRSRKEICLVLYYRATHVPGAGSGAGRAAWLGMLVAELWFGFYWVITQSVQWCPVR
uniref:Uncharacterized protein n=1 Tax=Setaria italica TaxID=4555 RepID=K4A2P3_SETIT